MTPQIAPSNDMESSTLNSLNIVLKKRYSTNIPLPGLLWLLFILFASYIVMGLLVGVLVETVSTVATLEREQLDIDFAQKVLWEMIDKGGADEDGDNRISETEYVNLLSRRRQLQHVWGFWGSKKMWETDVDLGDKHFAD